MVLNLESRKFRLIRLIMNLDSEATLSKIEKKVSEISGKVIFHEAIKPIRKSLSVDDMIKEQNYSPIKKEEFFELAEKIDIKEPIEDLLEMLKK